MCACVGIVSAPAASLRVSLALTGPSLLAPPGNPCARAHVGLSPGAWCAQAGPCALRVRVLCSARTRSAVPSGGSTLDGARPHAWRCAASAVPLVALTALRTQPGSVQSHAHWQVSEKRIRKCFERCARAPNLLHLVQPPAPTPTVTRTRLRQAPASKKTPQPRPLHKTRPISPRLPPSPPQAH